MTLDQLRYLAAMTDVEQLLIPRKDLEALIAVAEAARLTLLDVPAISTIHMISLQQALEAMESL